MLDESVDVLVVGGGVVGLASAVAMASRGFLVTVLDAGLLAASAIKTNTRVYAINTASKVLFEQLGVWALLPDEVLAPYQGMQVWDARNQAEINFNARDLIQRELGFILEEHVLRKALLTRAEALNITLVSNTCVSDCIETMEGMELGAQNGRKWHTKLCMIADGARSNTRDLLDVSVTSWSYQHDALVATVHTEKPHQAVAYQVFCTDGPLAFLPLKDAHQCSIVWSHPPERIKALMALDTQAFESALTSAFSDKLGAIQLASSRVSFPLRMRHVEQYVGASWMLLGDAAHTIHPLAGLGLNIGLADLNTWLQLLDQQKDGMWSSRVLGAYQRERKHAVWLVIGLMQGIKTIFGLSAMPVNLVRGMGIRVLNQVLPLKRIIMDYAAGKSM
ncbi:MAG: FAD-dependent oxidoreductase [Legionellaceae bacterium]|nr:FAD-dependent oxidoreductase [Legionellaceae bacterium]